MDLMLTEDGDLVVADNGDLQTVDGAAFIIQSIRNRLKSVSTDWFYDHIGADLIDFLGRPNTRETGNMITERVIETLTFDGLVSPDNLFIKAVPTDYSTITLFVFVKLDEMDSPVGFQVDLNLDSGATVKLVANGGAV